MLHSPFHHPPRNFPFICSSGTPYFLFLWTSSTKFLCCTWTNLNMHIPIHLMLTVLPQGLQYSSHLVRVWTLTYSLCLFQDYITCTYLLLCSLSLQISHSNTLLNILSSWEYKVSPSQLQVSTPQVSRINSYSNS